jgi:hypothetical protein
MTTFDIWHLRDGVKIWAAPRLRQPYLEMHERDGPLRVVLLADYEELMAQFEDALQRLRGTQPSHDEGSR